MSISVVIISYKSDHLLQNIITSIPNHFEIFLGTEACSKLYQMLVSGFPNPCEIIPDQISKSCVTYF